MKARKLLTEITGQGVMRKQRSEIINSKYFTSHESTSFCGQFTTSVDHLSSISLRDCLEELNSHLAESRPLRPVFVVQIKKFLSQCKGSDLGALEDQENKRKSKDSFIEDKFIIRSPYIVNRSLKKFKPTLCENQPIEIRRKTLRKRKINFENGEVQFVNKSKQQSIKSERKLSKKTLQAKQHCGRLNQQIKVLKDYLLSQIQNLKSYFSSQLQTIQQIASSTLRSCLYGVKKQSAKRQSYLSEKIVELEEKVTKLTKRQEVLQEYLNQRESQLVTCWAAFNLRPT